MKILPWLRAFRLRTLPLAIGAITMGAFAANVNGVFNVTVYLLAILTAILLQILSNLANDYGDFKKGTDNESRVGPARALQSGIISEKAMLGAVVLFAVLSLASGISLIWVALKDIISWNTLWMLAIGLCAIAAAIKYTVGKNAYGYTGWGDVFVFIFFGVVAVCGTYYLMAATLDWKVLLPAAAFGCLSVGVLNINNIRDIKNDKASNKITLAVKLGRQRAKTYHLVIIVAAIISLFAYEWIAINAIWFFLMLGALLFLIVLSTARVMQNNEGEEPKLNRELKALSLSSAFLSIGLFLLSFFI